jgi:trimeric autotransporter adhesin
MTWLRPVLAVVLLVLLIACGGSSKQSGITLLSIQITPANPSIPPGATQQFSAMGKYSDGSSQDLTSTAIWNSSNPTVATIAPAGRATAKAAGTSSITAASGSKTGSAVLTVTAPVLVSIALSPATATIAAGLSQQFTATGTLSDGSMQNLTASATWKSSASPVAMVSTTGLAQGVAVGTSTITAMSGTISGTANLTVTAALLTSISVTPANASVPLGILQQFTATGTYSDGTMPNISNQVTWSSSSSTIASISAAGMATARNLGDTTIKAVLGSISGATGLNVNAASLSSITIVDENITIAQHTSHRFTAIGLFNDGGTRDISGNVTWTSSTPAVATISGHSPIVKGVATGSTTIMAALGLVSASVTLNVTNALIQSISVTPTGRTIAPTTTIGFVATGTFNDSTIQPLNLDVSWSSSNTGAATISRAGVAQAITQGPTNIGASFGGVMGSALLTVSIASLTSITITPATALIAPASTQGFSATGKFSDGSSQPIASIAAWSSSDTTVATMNGAQATGQSAGTTTITAQVGSFSATADLVVAASPLASISIAPAVTSVPQDIGVPFTATGTFADGKTQVLTGAATWTSSPDSVASISNISASKGLATGVAPGQATITADFGGAVGVATLNVDDAILTSIDVAPSNPNIALGAQVQFTATGHFSDGTTLVLTPQVKWESSDATIAVISPAGTTSTAGLGTAAITATLNGVSGIATLTVH